MNTQAKAHINTYINSYISTCLELLKIEETKFAIYTTYYF